MKYSIILILFIYSCESVPQNSFYEEVELGKYKVGYFDTLAYDMEQQYNQFGYEGPAPIFIQVWHPLKKSSPQRYLTYKDFKKRKLPESLDKVYTKLCGQMNESFMDESYMMAGSAIEVLLFGFGLNYKLRLINREKILLEQSAHDNQMSALRAQMNPHFIFNSLNSIQYLISSDKKAPAMKYLNKFSILMRRLLEGSIKINVVLAEEIALLEKYIELEALRFNHSFTYRITTEDRLDIQEVELPPLIVQPFVENAILHGLGNKEKGEKHLDVRFMKNEKFLICEIEDNGVGREYSQKTKSSLYKSKTSRGIGVTEKRLRLLGASDRKLVEFIDKTDENGKPTGTLAIIKIPLEQN